MKKSFLRSLKDAFLEDNLYFIKYRSNLSGYCCGYYSLHLVSNPWYKNVLNCQSLGYFDEIRPTVFYARDAKVGLYIERLYRDSLDLQDYTIQVILDV